MIFSSEGCETPRAARWRWFSVMRLCETRKERTRKISNWVDASRRGGRRRTNLETLDQLLPSHLSVTQTPLGLVRDGLDSLEDGLDDLRLLCESSSDASNERLGVSSDSRIGDQETNGGEAARKRTRRRRVSSKSTKRRGREGRARRTSSSPPFLPLLAEASSS